jgi:hypothetical protein
VIKRPPVFTSRCAALGAATNQMDESLFTQLPDDALG